MKLVLQTSKWNCGSACLAMVLGKTIEYVEDVCLRRQPGDLMDPEFDDPQLATIGVTSFEMIPVLQDHGYPCWNYVIPPRPDGEKRTWYDRVGWDLPVIDPLNRTLDWMNSGNVAILGVASRTIEGGFHWIVSAGGEYFDPTPRRDVAYNEGDVLILQESLLIGDKL